MQKRKSERFTLMKSQMHSLTRLNISMLKYILWSLGKLKCAKLRRVFKDLRVKKLYFILFGKLWVFINLAFMI